MIGELRVSDDVSAGAWIAPRLRTAPGTVTGTVPSGFPAYVRICHPAQDPDGSLVTWTQVAQRTGRQTHPLMQWHALVGSPDPLNMRGSLWPGSDPSRGRLVPDVLGPLCALLAGHTEAAGHCFFGLWDGYGWIHGNPAVAMLRAVRSGEPALSAKVAPPTFSLDELSRPRLRLPARDYLLLLGPLHAALQIGHWPAADWFIPQSPNLFWPADQAWCVASEIDFDSTLVGGTTKLIDAIIGAPAFDAWPVRPDDSLTADADRINPLR